MAHMLGGLVTVAQDDAVREYGKTEIFYDATCKLLRHCGICGLDRRLQTGLSVVDAIIHKIQS